MGVTDIGAGAAGAGGITAPPMTPGIAGPVSPSIPSTVNLGSQGGVMGTKGGIQGAMDVASQKVSDVMTTGKGVLSDSMAWMEKNPKLTQAGAGLLTAGLSGYAQQEQLKEQMRAQEEAQARARKRLNESVSGVTMPVYQRKGG